MSEGELNDRVRSFIFDELMQRNHAPTVEETSQALGAGIESVRNAYCALADGHVIVLQSTGDILAANPYAAVPSPFVVETDGQIYNGICIWDALGIVANLGRDATVRTTCGDCSESLVIDVRDGKLARGAGNVVHISVPAIRWWENIVFS